jgi:hypothetical protein
MKKDLCIGSEENHDCFVQNSLYEELGNELVDLMVRRWYSVEGKEFRCLSVTQALKEFKKMVEEGEIEIEDILHNAQ